MQDGRAGHALGHHQRAAVRAAPRVLPAQRILLALLQPGLLLLVQLAHALGVFPREVLVFRAAGFVGGHRSFLLTTYGCGTTLSGRPSRALPGERRRL